MDIITSGLCLFQRVGSNYGVIDLDDGVIDWITKEELIQYAKKYPIAGVDLVNKTIKPVICSIPCSKCNWNKDDSNIFTDVRAFNVKYNINDLSAKVITGSLITKTGKSIKFRWSVSSNPTRYYFICYNNIKVYLDADTLLSLLDKWNLSKKEADKILAKLCS